MMVIGIDPSGQHKGHGVSIYRDGTLEELHMLKTKDIVLNYLIYLKSKESIFFSIEDVLSQNFTYASNGPNQRSIGMCQMAQREIISWLVHFGIGYALYKPHKDNWHDRKAMFERVTGWKGKSNDDTRSAAYFGFLEKDRKFISINE